MAKEVAELKLHPLMAGATLLETSRTSTLFGCPPEILKYILAKKLPIPNTAVLSGNLKHGRCSQGAVEFVYFYYLFIYGGINKHGKFRIVATEKQCQRLKEAMRLVLLGATVEEMCEGGMPYEIAEELGKEFYYMAMPNPETNEPFTVDETIEWIPLESGQSAILYPKAEGKESIKLNRINDISFVISKRQKSLNVDLSIKEKQSPIYKIQHKPMVCTPNALKITVLGASDGFDPQAPANGFLMNFQGKLGIWDCPAYLHQHLEKLEISFDQVDALILSHTHEDHIDVVESIRENNPIDLYCTAEVYQSLVSKIMLIMDCDEESAKQFHQWHPITVGKPYSIIGAEFEFFYSVHAIPCTGCYISVGKEGKKKRVMLSSDHASFALMREMRQAKMLSKKRFHQMENLIRGNEDLILMDAGGGAIHGDYLDYFNHKLYVSYMHAGELPLKPNPTKHLVEHAEILDLADLDH